MKKIVYLYIVFLTVPSFLYSQPERWLYFYDGGDSLDGERALKIVQDEAGNIYTTGYVNIIDGGYSYFRLAVLSFTHTGDLRWSYISSGAWDSKGYDIAYEQGNLFITGVSSDIWWHTIITMSIDTNGNLNWVKLHGLDPGEGKSIAVGNGYVFVGAVVNVDTQGYYFPALLVYHTDGTYSGATYYNLGYVPTSYDYAYLSIHLGSDGNIYMSTNSATVPSQSEDFTVLSFQPNGNLNFSYHYDSGNTDEARSVIYGNDGNVYAVGSTGDGDSLCIVSLTPSGSLRWISQKRFGSGIASGIDITQDGAGNLYAVGSMGGYFTSLSLDTSGNFRWIDSTSNVPGNPSEIILGEDGNLYETGYYSYGNGDVLCYTVDGQMNFSYSLPYQYCSDAMLFSIVYGQDGYLYICGTGDNGDGTYGDDFVFSLDPASLGVEENPKGIKRTIEAGILGSKVVLNLKEPTYLGLDVYSVNGALVNKIFYGFMGEGMHSFELSNLLRGVYFIRIRTDKKIHTLKFLRL